MITRIRFCEFRKTTTTPIEIPASIIAPPNEVPLPQMYLAKATFAPQV
jgi:hypothetical protein